MKTAIAFEKKEIKEYIRTGKGAIISAIFVLFGLMNPAMVKITPYLLEKFSNAEETGMVIKIANIDASMSWAQFYKNVPMALIACCLLLGASLTDEMQRGTIVLVLTKGLSRWKVVLLKAINLCLIWSAGYWACYGITYFYTGYYWDNSVVGNIAFSAMCYWILGLMIMSLIILFSTAFSSYAGAIVGTGAVYAILSFLAVIPSLAKYLPTYLASSQRLLNKTQKTSDFFASIVITCVVIVIGLLISCVLFNKKEINHR